MQRLAATARHSAGSRGSVHVRTAVGRRPSAMNKAWTGGGEERLRCSHRGIGPRSYFFRSGRIDAVKWTRR